MIATFPVTFFCVVSLIYLTRVVSSMGMTTVSVSEENKKKLAKFGDASESLNDCLSRVLDLAEAMRAGGA